jgi:antitoxin VapB
VTQTAKLFMNGKSQAVRLPAAYRFDGKEVFIRQDPISGDIILSRRPENLDAFLVLARSTAVPEAFLGSDERQQAQGGHDPFMDWQE